MECKDCGETVSNLVARGLCSKCYAIDVEKRKTAECLGCKEIKPIKAKGLCRKCYARFQRHGDFDDHSPVKGAKLCSYCHERPVHARRLCTRCYARYLHHGSPEIVKFKKVQPCKFCGETKAIVAKGLCGKCYQRARMNNGNPEYAIKVEKIRPCGFCGKDKEIRAKGLCASCYQRYQQHGTPEYVKVRKVCSVDGCEELSVAKELCDKHYRRWEKHGHTEPTRPNGWGSKEKHPLYNTWHWMKRKHGIVIAKEWMDFWTFVKDVGERPSEKHKFKVINESEVVYKDNYEWATGQCQQRESETDEEFRIRYLKHWRKHNRRYTKELELKKHYEITLDEYHDLIESQNNVCAICGKPEFVKDQHGKLRSLAVDHDHATGEIRGLLCTNCNKGIGHLQDSITILTAAINYLKNHASSEA
jgi:hypothetical protein